MRFWNDKVALITGGSSGLGRAIADAFAAAGAKVVIAALEADAVDAAVKAICSAGGEAAGYQADLTRQEDVQRLFAQAITRFGRLDVLVNNAGRSVRGAVLDTTPEQFRELLELNFLSAVRCTRAAAEELLKRRGHVVNIGSLASKAAARWVGAYPATKFALAAYSQQLRLELGPRGLHVLLVCPGPIQRAAPRLYALEGADRVPESARLPGAGVRLKAVSPSKLAAMILTACRRRQAELVVPARTRLLFALSQLWPDLGDWIISRKSG